MLGALVKAVDIASERRYKDPSYWPGVIEAVNDLVPEKDMKNSKNFATGESTDLVSMPMTM